MIGMGMGLGIGSGFILLQAPAFVGILDGLPASSNAYALRRLALTYTGVAARVKRSSDNAELDIGYSTTLDANGNQFIDTVSLLNFVGVGDGFSVTLYNQVGATNLTQATAANQGQLVVSGVVNLQNGKPTIVMSSMQFMQGDNTGFTTAHTISAVARCQSVNNTRLISRLILTGAGEFLLGVTGTTQTRYLVRNNVPANIFATVGSSPDITNNAVYSGRWNGSNIAAYFNGTKGADITLTGTLTASTQPFTVNGDAVGTRSAMNFSEVIEWKNTALSDFQMTTLTTNQRTAYGV